MRFDYSADQAKQRRDVRLEDQFGRWWGTAIEKSTGDPCCEISPVGGWSDPLNTPNIYLRVPRHEDGSTIAGKIEIQFDRWITSIRSSTEDWLNTIDEAGRVSYKVTTPEERALWPQDEYLKKIAGPEPLPTVETLMRARDGDRQLLGLTKDVKTGTTHPADMTYMEFVVENREDEFGKFRNMVTIGKLWQEHKAFLKGEEPEVEEAVKVLEEVEA